METFAKVLIVDKVQGARNAETEIVRGVQRGCEYRATQQFAAISNTCQLSWLSDTYQFVLRNTLAKAYFDA
ncbi:MAG: hypothetical protein Q8L73_03660 [Methylotenera sp.]|nr:hypothetical protein [Methylotenera sp.]